MEQFASGWKRNYYGKGDVIAYRLNRDGVTADQQAPVFGASVKMLLYGDAFRPTYNRGDNTGLIATDSMKNFIQRETLNYTGPDLEQLPFSSHRVSFIRKWRVCKFAPQKSRTPRCNLAVPRSLPRGRWCARRDSNPRPTDSKSVALSG